jgi:hypothetical protein
MTTSQRLAPVLVSGNGGSNGHHNSINKSGGGGGSGATPGLEAFKLGSSDGGSSKSPSTKGAFGSASNGSSFNGESGISAHQQQQEHPLSGGSGVDGNGKHSANTCLTPAGIY